MPKLESSKEQYVNGYRVDKENDNVIYSDEKHVYFDKKDNERYISVTTLIGEYERPFDSEFWSSYKACEALCTADTFKPVKQILLRTKKWKEDFLDILNIKKTSFNKKKKSILQEYEDKKNTACERGTKIHAMFENQYYKQEKHQLPAYGLGGTFECKQGYYNLDDKKGIYPEFLISYKSDDNELRIAGQMDLLIKDDNDIYIVDYKGLCVDTIIPTPNGFVRMYELKEGDYVYDKYGKPTKVLHKSTTHYNDCYHVTFDGIDHLIADCDHRWEVYVNGETKVVTTTDVFNYLQNGIEVFVNRPTNIQGDHIDTDVNLYNFGCCLTSGSFEKYGHLNQNQCEMMARSADRITGEMIIPEIYLNASSIQRTLLFNGILNANGKYDKTTGLISLGTFRWGQIHDIVCLINSLGFEYKRERVGDDEFIIYIGRLNQLRQITEVVISETVPTQCIEVDSPTHTYLCTDKYIVTHNTNKEIKKESYYNPNLRSREMMLSPLNKLMDCNFYHYSMQLSTYAYMLQQLNPNFVIKQLKIVHIDHDDKQHEYYCKYYKDEVAKMFEHYKRKKRIKQSLDRDKPIEF